MPQDTDFVQSILLSSLGSLVKSSSSAMYSGFVAGGMGRGGVTIVMPYGIVSMPYGMLSWREISKW